MKVSLYSNLSDHVIVDTIFVYTFGQLRSDYHVSVKRIKQGEADGQVPSSLRMSANQLPQFQDGRPITTMEVHVTWT